MSNVTISHDSVHESHNDIFKQGTLNGYQMTWNLSAPKFPNVHAVPLIFRVCLEDDTPLKHLQTEILVSWSSEHENTAVYFGNTIAWLWSIISCTDEKMINRNKRKETNSWLMMWLLMGAKGWLQVYKSIFWPHRANNMPQISLDSTLSCSGIMISGTMLEQLCRGKK